MRKEKDALGELLISDDAYYGIQTERARKNMVSGHTISEHPTFIRSLAAIMKAAAFANLEIGALPKEEAMAIAKAADEVMNGEMASQFPLDVLQGGGGTSTNMNMNEVIANRANELLIGRKGYDRIHPNSHVNLGQSTNDVIPAAMKLTCFFELETIVSGLKALETSVKQKAEEFSDVVKIARTCLQDALPITLGQEFLGYLGLIQRHIAKTERVSKHCLAIPLGATAVGTGLGSFPGYCDAVIRHLSEILGLKLEQEDNLFDALQNADLYIDVSGVLKSLATGLSKIATDLRIMSSGPQAGLAEIFLPPVQPGSSIMPGKVNPVIPELVNQVCYQVCGNDFAITMAVEGGELDLNVWEPVIIKCLHESCTLLVKCMPLLAESCIDGIVPNRDRCNQYAESSLAASTVLASALGYEIGSKITVFAAKHGMTLKDAAVELGHLTVDEADKHLNNTTLTDPDRSALAVRELANKSRV